MSRAKSLPTKINIFGKTVSVVRVEMKDGEFGEYEQHKRIIKINKKSAQEEAFETLFHEAIHAALHISGLSAMLPVDKKVDLEEAIVTCLENAFSDAIDVDKLRVEK